jgi:LysR family hydrogen peroxide-inducible transcriptional activator
MSTLPAAQQLRYLVSLAELQHFGRAAASCGVTQSTLSAGLIALERHLDAAILDRSAGKHVAFTALGEEVVSRARLALAALEAVSEAVDAARRPMSGPLRLGVIPTIGPFLLPRLMPRLRESFADLRLFLREDTTANCLERLAAHRLDVVLLALPCDCDGAETLPVVTDDFVGALPPGSALASAERVSLAQLASERLLLLEDGHCLRDQALAACGQTATPSDPYAATSLHTLVQMVAGGLGATLLPRIAIDAGVTAGTDVVLRELRGRGAWRTLGLAWRPNSARAAEFRALAPLLASAAGGRVASRARHT